ncbi:hypothetical protein F7F28_30395 [Escherichia coli]|nr:hypothetical protein F7F28_30395 [Escherichia coli]KAB0238745.1 hypothetical protein F7E91_30125 [Escherichia coli]
MDSVHHIWCPLFSQEFQDLPDGAETTLTKNPGNLPHHRSPDRQPPRMPICQQYSHCGYKNNNHGPV